LQIQVSVNTTWHSMDQTFFFCVWHLQVLSYIFIYRLQTKWKNNCCASIFFDFIYVIIYYLTVFQMDVVGSDTSKIDLQKLNKKFVFQSFLTPNVIAFLAVSVFNGLCHFYIDTYFAVFMMELGASDFLLS
jgi:hypothetical protein